MVGAPQDNGNPWQSIVRLEREFASLRESVARSDGARSQWEQGAKFRLDEIDRKFDKRIDDVDKRFDQLEEKIDHYIAEIRSSTQASLSLTNVAIVEVARRVTGIEMDRAQEKGKFKGGLAMLSAIIAAASAVGGGIAYLATWMSGHLK